MKKINIKNTRKLNTILGLSFVLATTNLSGCSSKVITDDVTETYTTIDSTNETQEIEPQILTVEGENFKLIVENYLNKEDASSWRITTNKQLITKICTKNLPADTQVWIDNIHMDSYIVAATEEMNNIKQDSMDDHSHSENILGFPISNEVCYYGTFEIEGQNSEFIEGSSYGFNGYNSGTITQRRHSESEYLSKTVYANKISSVYDLWIKKGDNEPYMTTAKSSVVVLVDNELKVKEKDKIKIRKYKRDGSYEIISESEIEESE